MEITGIREAGCNNLLMYSLQHGADLVNDQALVSLINDEYFYLVTISDLTFYEVFRLTQMYRDKLRTLSSGIDATPITDEGYLAYFGGESFNGTESRGNSLENANTGDAGENISLPKQTESCVRHWLSLVAQLNEDSDIIRDGASRLFIPMLSRRCTVQIPVGFYDFLSSINREEANELFSDKYPSTLADIVKKPVHGVKTSLGVGIAKATSIIRYDKRYDTYLQNCKYFPLRGSANADSTNLYKLGLLGFAKRDLITRSEVRFSLYKTNPEVGLNTMKRLSKLKSPLEVDFVVQLPIEYMQILLNTYGRDILPVQYESSMSTILDNGIQYEDFKTLEWVDESSEEGLKKIEEHDNAIAAYRVRIAEANGVLLNTIKNLMESKADISTSSIFSLLPSIYSATAVITVNVEHLKLFTSHYDPLINTMFRDIEKTIENIQDDLRKAKD